MLHRQITIAAPVDVKYLIKDFVTWKHRMSNISRFHTRIYKEHGSMTLKT